MRDPHVLTRRSEVGRRLREFRRESGLTQAQLARADRIGQASLSNYESGKRELPLVVAVNLAGALAISLGELLDIPGILVVHDADMGRAIRALAASPRLLDSVVPPVEAAEDEAAADQAEAAADEDEATDDASDGDEAGGASDEGDADDGSGEDEHGGDDDNGDDDDGNAVANDAGDADEDDGRDADEAS